jgi:hypothetical protein
VLTNAFDARYVNKNLSEQDYRSIQTTANQNYETTLNKEISRTLDYGRGILLNPDTMGFIDKAPIRYKMFGDFQQDFMDWIAQNGATVKPSEIFTEGRRLAAMHLVSDEKLQEMESDIRLQIKEKEGKIYQPKRTELTPVREEEFKKWLQKINKKTGVNINPDDPNNLYDYRGAFKAGVKGPDETGNWPSEHLKEKPKIKSDVLGEMTRKQIEPNKPVEPNFTPQQQDEALRKARKNLPADATNDQIIDEAEKILREGK